MCPAELEYVEYFKEAPMKCMVISIENSSPHWHYEYEVFFVLRGAVTVNTESGVFRLEKGDIILFNSCEVHSMIQPERDNICVVLQFSLELIAEVYKTSFHFKLNTKLDMPRNKKAILEFQTILAEMGLLLFEKPDGYQFYIKSYLYLFIGSLFRNLYYKINKSNDTTQRIEDLEDFNLIKQYIKTHFKEDLKQDKLCKELGMSRSKVFRLLKSVGSDSTKDLINYYRIEYAKNLLQNTKHSISYISAESGFKSNSSFYRVFKSLTGVSPNHYRKSSSIKMTYFGIQGYLDYPVSDAISLLREYSYQGLNNRICITSIKGF